MSSRRFRAVVWIACVAPNVGLIWGQAVNGTILGTVRDTSGGVIAMALASATSLETGAVRTAMSHTTGAYQIVSVPAGNYEVANTGFKTSVRRGISVTEGTSVPVNFELAVGGVQQRAEEIAKKETGVCPASRPPGENSSLEISASKVAYNFPLIAFTNEAGSRKLVITMNIQRDAMEIFS